MRVLVVDDNLLSRTQIMSQIRRAGWEVTSVALDADALGHLSGDRPDAVIVNLAAARPSLQFSPETSSRPAAFVRALRGEASWSEVPVLGFCGHTERRRREEGLASGCTKVETNGSVASSVTELIRALTAPARIEGGN
jgi:CheY-like chemotaxis protein